jgi:UDP-N-acetylmuramate--alanine ligase
LQQSEYSLLWEKDVRALGESHIDADYEAYDELMDLGHIKLAGAHVRQNAFLVQKALERLTDVDKKIVEAINTFPGTSRRMEKLADNLYSDYGHHPAEIAATLQLARELSDHVVLVYQPHQNVRQHEIRDQYTDCMEQADSIYWLPTYLSRENPQLEVLTPEQLSAQLTNQESVHVAELDDDLWAAIKSARSDGKLVLCMGAGNIDAWLRSHL